MSFISPLSRKSKLVPVAANRCIRASSGRAQCVLLVFLCAALVQTGCHLDSDSAAISNEAALVSLGRHLFYERRLSLNENRSCGICHEQAKGFTDGFVRAVGTTGEIHPRNTLTLLNVRSRDTLSWVNPSPMSLAEQMLIPLTGTTPVEMGAHEVMSDMLASLNADNAYQSLLAELRPPRDEMNLDLVTEAIAAFTESLVDYNSPYDRYVAGDESALSAQAKDGEAIFFSSRGGCSNCHGGIDFDAPTSARHGWYNTGLYNLGSGHYPPGRQGLYEITGLEQDIGKYRVPTLRHLRDTGPYYHDGTGASLSDVLNNYNQGGRNVKSGPYLGDGRTNPYKAEAIRPLNLTPGELEALEVFLLSLSNNHVLTKPEWSDPWPRPD